MLTTEERVVLHLLDHVRRAERFEVPFGMSQAGIALAVSARRSHVSATLGEMERRRLVEKRMGHLEGGGRRRKVYALTPAGAQAAESLRQRVAAMQVRVRAPGGERSMPLRQALPLAPRGTSLLDLALAVTDGVLDLEGTRHRGPPAGATPRRFYGRSEELALAREFLRSDATCLAIRGLPGVGKTAFLARLAESADPATAAWIRVTEWTTPDHVLASLASKLRAAGPSIEIPSGAEAGVEETLSRLAAEASDVPLLAFLDDVHKSQESLVRLLPDLVRAFRGTRAKVVVAGRRIPPFYSRREVAIEGTVRELEIGGLDEASARALLEDRGVPEDRRPDVLVATKGHPLFLELMAASGGRGLGDVRAYLREEVASRLEPREQEILAALAVHRGPVAVEAVAAEVADVGRLEGLADRCLVRLGGGAADMHDLLREFFSSRLTTPQRLRLHAAAATHYESRPDAESRVEMVYHLIQAGKPKEAASVLAGLGRGLTAKGRPDDVLRLLALLDLKALDAADRVPLVLLRGDILSMRGEWTRAQASFDEAATLAEDLGDRRGHARAVFELGVLEYRRGDFDAARSRYDAALAIVGDADEAITARILNALGILEWQIGHLDAAADLYERSKLAYETAGDAAGVAGAINNLGILRWQQGDVDGALAQYAESLRLSEEIGDDRTVAILYNNIGEAYRRKGDPANAAKFYDRSLALSEKLGFLWHTGEVHRNFGRLLPDARGTDHLRRALAIFESLGARRDRDEVVRLLGERG
jgi:tetratricopeptide (TPR) repeat protein/DNA-binding MarR family transcriptional regulator